MKKDKFEENIKCDICGYQNHKKYVKYSGVCHLCGNILDGKAYFKQQMNKKLRIWRDDKSDVWGKGINQVCNKQVKRTKD